MLQALCLTIALSGIQQCPTVAAPGYGYPAVGYYNPYTPTGTYAYWTYWGYPYTWNYAYGYPGYAYGYPFAWNYSYGWPYYWTVPVAPAVAPAVTPAVTYAPANVPVVSEPREGTVITKVSTPRSHTTAYATQRNYDEQGNIVNMTDQAMFEPAMISINVGDMVEWRNVSKHVHTVTADPDLADNEAHVVLPLGAEPFHSGDIAPGAKFTHTFTTPGTYYYICMPHEHVGMVGIVHVRVPDSPAPTPRTTTTRPPRPAVIVTEPAPVTPPRTTIIETEPVRPPRPAVIETEPLPPAPVVPAEPDELEESLIPETTEPALPATETAPPVVSPPTPEVGPTPIPDVEPVPETVPPAVIPEDTPIPDTVPELEIEEGTPELQIEE